MQALLLVLLCFSSYSSNAQTAATTSGTTSDILVLGNGWTGNLSQCTYGVDCWAGSTDNGDVHSGAGAGGVQGTFYFSGTEQTITNTIALSIALQAAGIQVDGYNYKWVYKNGNAHYYQQQGDPDDLEIVVNVYDDSGNLFKSYTYDYSGTFTGWVEDTGTETFNTQFLDPSMFGNVEVMVTGKDVAGWSGYYGPEFRWEESEITVNYSANLCYNNQLYDATCPGYANALFNQQCTLNALYDPSCPGYAAAYLTQQCTANPLYDPACSGYQQAYLNQQCKLDPLYDKSCSGYLTAQCNIDPLYDSSCTGYAAAYLADRCYYDPLYDVQCTGYQQAYFDQQCEMDSQYDQLCPTYLDPELVDLGDFDPLEEATAEPEVQVGVAELDFSQPTVEAPPVVEQPVVVESYVPEAGGGFQEVDDSIDLEQQNMEDDIETEIAELESQAEEEEVDNPFEKDRDESELEEEDEEIAEAEIESDTRPDNTDGEAGSGGTAQDDDIEKEIAALEKEADTSSEKKQKKKVSTKNDKIRMLLAQKAIALTKEIENAVTIEQQMLVQRQLLALISFVPGFDYAEDDILDLANFYPPKPTVDHAYARWFLNDPNFGAMEDLQYNFK